MIIIPHFPALRVYPLSLHCMVFGKLGHEREGILSCLPIIMKACGALVNYMIQYVYNLGSYLFCSGSNMSSLKTLHV